MGDCWAARGSAGRRIAPRTDVPAWLVFGVILRAADMAHVEEVQAAAGVSLLSEGFEMIDTDAIIGSFARHLMTAFDRWNERGFEAIARDYLERLPKRKAGERRSIDRNGDLLVSAAQPAAGRPTGPALWMRSPGWLGMIRRCAVRNSDEADMLKFPRTIRLDPSDTFVFERAAEPGEWAVSGAFVFWNQDPATLGQKQRVALRSGFLGYRQPRLVHACDRHRGDGGGQAGDGRAPRGPDCWRNSAHRISRPRVVAAEEEVAFAASLCDHPPQTLLAVQRSVENGEIRERFRTLKPREAAPGGDRLHAHASAFTFHEIEGDIDGLPKRSIFSD